MSKLRELIAATTPGPWYVAGWDDATFVNGSDGHCACKCDALNGRHKTDAALIVALVNHAEAIAELIEAARAQPCLDVNCDFCKPLVNALAKVSDL